MLPGSDDFTEFDQTFSEGDTIVYKLVLKKENKKLSPTHSFKINISF